MKRRKKFIEVSQSLGRFSIGLLSITQVALGSLGFFGAILIDYFGKVGMIPATLLISALIIPITIVLGERPDRFLRQLLFKPPKWKRGFEPAQPLLKK